MAEVEELRQRACGPEHELRGLANQMHALIKEGQCVDALAIADAMILSLDAPLHFYCNALWLTMKGNTGMPLSERRARRFLTASLLRAPANSEIYLNAAFVFLELGDAQEGMRHLLLAKQHGVDLGPHLAEPACEPLRSDARWAELEGELHAEVEPVHWTRLVADTVSHDDLDSAVPVLLMQWRGNRHPHFADVLDRMASRTGHRAGYRAGEIERCLTESPLELANALDRDSMWRVDEEDNEWLSYQLDDPRFSTALGRILSANPSFPAEKRVERGWLAMIKYIAAARDGRMAELLRRFAEHTDQWFPELMRRTIANAMNAAATRIEERASPEALDAATVECLSALEASLPEPKPIFEPPPAAVCLAPAEAEPDALLSIWRRTHSTRVASLLQVVDPGPSIAAAIREMDQGWDFDNYDANANEAAQVLWRLRKSPPDPRVTEDLAQLIAADAPFRYPVMEENGVDDYWGELLRLFGEYADLRSLPHLRSLSEGVHAFCKDADDWSDEEMYVSHRCSIEILRRLKEVIPALEAVHELPLSADEETLICAAEAEHADALARYSERKQRAEEREQRSAELLQAVLADPGSDDARLAYAAHLEEMGLPHGEFIRLQVTGEDPARQEELEEHHGSSFLGPLARITESVRFRRGFPVEATTNAYNIRRKPYEGPLLATIESLKFDTLAWSRSEKIGPPIDAFVLSEHFRSLRELVDLPVDAFVRLVSAGLTRLEAVTLDVAAHREVDWSAVQVALNALPRLRELRVDIYSADKFAAAAPLLACSAPIAAVEFHVGSTERISNWPEIVDCWRSSAFPELLVRNEGLSFRFVRSDRSLTIRKAGTVLAPVLNALLCLPADAFAEFSLELDGDSPPPFEYQTRALESALERFTLTRCELPEARAGEGAWQKLNGGKPSIEELCERAPTDPKAIRALGYLRAQAAVPALLSILDGERVDEAEAALKALVRIGSEQLPERVLPRIRRLVQESLDAGGDGPERKRWAALDALGRLRDVGALPLLRRAFDEGSFSDKRSAAIAFGAIGQEQDLPRIEEMTENKQFRDRFLIALVTLAPSRLNLDIAKSITERFQKWERWVRRESIIELLIELPGVLAETQETERAFLRDAIRDQIHAWRAMTKASLIDDFRPENAAFLETVDALEEAWR